MVEECRTGRAEHRWYPLVAYGTAAVATAAVCSPLFVHRGEPGFSVAEYFGYFTVLTNVFCIGVLVASVLADPSGPRMASARGAATTYAVTTGVVYAVMSDAIATDLAPWVDGVTHRLVPLVMLIAWLGRPPRRPIAPAQALWWAAFPAGYGAAAVVWGSVGGWYPYPFFDPAAAGGYGPVAVDLLVLTGVVAGFALAVRTLGDLARRLREPASRTGGRHRHPGPSPMVRDGDRSGVGRGPDTGGRG